MYYYRGHKEDKVVDPWVKGKWIFKYNNFAKTLEVWYKERYIEQFQSYLDGAWEIDNPSRVIA